MVAALILSLLPSALLLNGALPRCAPPPTALRCASPCCEAMSDDAKAAVPPGQLAEAWQRDEKAKELNEMLKGCSLYVVGLGGRKTAAARVLARRLKYRFYDVTALMCSTYAALSGGGEVSLPQLVAKEPLADVEQLSGAVLGQVQQITRSVFVAWDGAIDTGSYAVMQQGIVVNLVFEATEEGDVALPSEDAEEVRQKWLDGHTKADLTVTIAQGAAADDAAYSVASQLLAYIKANPAKSAEWKAEADAKLAEADKKKKGA